MFDTILKNGTIIDGTGSPRFHSDVGIKKDKIEAIGDLSKTLANRIVNVNGLIVAPGFIDTHTHSDASLLKDPQHEASLRQGVTTEILGQDGLSYAPLSPNNYNIYAKYLAGILGRPPTDIDTTSVKAFRSNYHEKVSINTAYNIAHGAVSLEVNGFHDRAMTGDTMNHAKQLISDGMEQGAVGFATGLSYHPQAWSTTEELIELCKVVASYGGIYVTHLRDVNPERGFGGGGIPEALEIGRLSGVKVHFSHHRTDSKTAGQVADRMELIDKAKLEGVDVTCELYPYPVGSSFPMSMLPSYAHEGGPEAIINRLMDRSERTRLAKTLHDAIKNNRGVVEQRHERLANALLSYLPKNSHLEGMSLSEIARSRKQSYIETLFDLLVEEKLEIAYWQSPPESVAIWQQVDHDALELLSRPDYMVGSDAIHVGSMPHPRAYGTFPRILGRLRRRWDIISLEDTVQRISDNPAQRFGLKHRGRIQEGYFADITIFDENKIIDTATFDDAKQFPVGIPYVLVNGQIAVDNGQCTVVTAGRAIP